jgi:5-methyltetrahydrofolate--homocysteine methyltransferase
METRVTGPAKEVIVSNSTPTVIIGERINPSGNKRLAEALRKGDMEFICGEVLAQVKAGADIIDVNVSTFGVEEETMLPKVIQILQEKITAPLSIDSANPAALEAGLRVYKGKALVNSVTGEKNSLESILPLVKEYKAAVIGLVQDDEGIPRNRERRLSIAHKLVLQTDSYGISLEDIIIDCLAPAIGTDSNGGIEVLQAIRQVKTELGVNQTIGASNLSFGMPDRVLLNNAFIASVLNAGVTCLITNAATSRPIIRAVDLILCRDKRGTRYIQDYRRRQTS